MPLDNPLSSWLFSAMSLVGCLLLLSGCGARAPESARLHQIYIDKDANLLDPVDDDSIEDQVGYVDKMMANIQGHMEGKPGSIKTNRIVIYIHGGLNGRSGIVSQAVSQTDEFLKDGAYPIFIEWDSGLFPNYFDHLFFVRRGKRINAFWGVLSSPYVLAEDLVRGIIRAPGYYVDSFSQATAVNFYIYDQEERESDAFVSNALASSDSANDIRINLVGQDSGHTFLDMAMIWNPLKLVTGPLIGEGLGTGSWLSMLRRSDLVLTKTPNERLTITQKEHSPEALKRTDEVEYMYEKNKTAATLLIERLVGSKYHIDLIGHSMGTIVANKIVSKYPDLELKNIVHMAAACRLKDIEESVSPYLKLHPECRYYNLTLNPYRDVNEPPEQYNLDVLPRGSLLVLIDQIFGDINSFQDRTAGFWFNLTRVANQIFPPEIRGQVTLTRFGIRDGTPQVHGAFNDTGMRYWTPEFWTGDRFEAAGLKVRRNRAATPGKP